MIPYVFELRRREALRVDSAPHVYVTTAISRRDVLGESRRVLLEGIAMV